MKSLHTRIRTMRRSGQRGVALIIVLSMLVLLSALLVAFMSSAKTELEATQAASAGSDSRMLADTTVNLVIGQLREATTQADEQTTWASQPGAIRTYSGKLNNSKRTLGTQGAYYYDYTPASNDYVYKLYSSERMKVRSRDYSSKDLADEVSVIENWKEEKPEGYVDLNEPLINPRYDLDPSGKQVEPRYPVVDPRAMFDKDGQSTSLTNTSNPPIVEGFDAKLTFDQERVLADSNERLPYLPMPVQWLYVMKDGTVGAQSLATKENPIVGRTAFWVDDESTKLNINTASEGTYWDTPSVSTEQEAGDVNGGKGLTSSKWSLSLATATPVAGEYQRYGGHPYTTCLSPVFGWMWDLTPNMSLYPMSNPAYKTYKENIYQIAPFAPNGRLTSIAATQNAEPFMPAISSQRPKHTVATKRLYATVDELMFKSSRNTGGENGKAELNDFTKKFTPDALEKTRFFLTANSRAPELNLFGRPRVTLWPVHANYKYRTQFDAVFAFTSTIAKTLDEDVDVKYFLTREDNKSDIKDYGAQNKKMFEYLSDLTKKDIPGFGGSFSKKYNTDQILTEILDYVRTVNLVDTGTASKTTNVFVPYTPAFYPSNIDSTYDRRSRSIDWSGQVTPLKTVRSGNTQNPWVMGMGRFPTLSEAAFVFHRIGQPAGSANDKIQATFVYGMGNDNAWFPCHPGNLLDESSGQTQSERRSHSRQKAGAYSRSKWHTY